MDKNKEILMVFDTNNKKSIVVDKHFTCPIRYFFKLNYEFAEKQWKDAINPKSLGGNGDCEKLALIGDAALNYHVICILQLKYPNSTTKEIYNMKQKYIMNSNLAKFDSWCHFSVFLKTETLIQRKLSEKEISTIIEALLGACHKIYEPDITRNIVQNMMDVIDGKPLGICCGSALITKNGEIAGMISCAANSSGITIFSLEQIKTIFNES